MSHAALAGVSIAVWRLLNTLSTNKPHSPSLFRNLLDAVPGDLELVSEARGFSAPERLELPAGTRVRVDGPSWTLSAWVKMDRGNILKQVRTRKLLCFKVIVDPLRRQQETYVPFRILKS
jgi:hypothetical protein